MSKNLVKLDAHDEAVRLLQQKRLFFLTFSGLFLCVLFRSWRCDFCLLSLIACVTVSLPGYIFCSPPSAEVDQRVDVLFTPRVVLALTRILHQSLNTFRARCKTWRAESKTRAAAAAAGGGLESAHVFGFFTISFVEV